MKAKIVLLFMLLVSSSSSAQQKMSTSEIQNLKNQIEKEAKSTTSFTADFSQKKYMKALAQPVLSSGKMYVKMPDQVRIETLKPDQTVLVFNGTRMKFTAQGKTKEMQVDKNKNFNQLRSLIVGAHNGSLLNDAAYTVAYFKKGSQYSVQLTPKNKEKLKGIQQIELFFTSGDAMVSEVKIIESPQNYTWMTFSNKKRNPSLQATLFQ